MIISKQHFILLFTQKEDSTGDEDDDDDKEEKRDDDDDEEEDEEDMEEEEETGELSGENYQPEESGESLNTTLPAPETEVSKDKERGKMF